MKCTIQEAWLSAYAATIVCALIASVVSAQAPEPVTIPDTDPQQVEEFEDVGIDEKLGDQLPLDLTFVDEDGREVKLGDFFNQGKPVLFTPVYFTCPMLCNLVLNGQVETMSNLQWTPGEEYEVVTLSFDPRETHTLAKLKKGNYIKEFGRPSSASGWHFLTGKEENIKKAMEAIGFRYRWVESQQQYSHAAALVVCTPEGRISRYLYGVQYNPQTLRLSLVEASEGRIGSTVDKLILYCFQYDPDSSTYVVQARRLMSLGGAATMAVLLLALAPRWVRDARRRAVVNEAAREDAIKGETDNA